jgi:hypothetical protein
LVRHPAFERAELATDFVDRHWHPAEAVRSAAARAARAAIQASASADVPGVSPAWPRTAWRGAALREGIDRWPR